jgi:uncharacterized protein (TIGR02246 family)
VDDIEAIKQLKARYFRTFDTKDWDGYRQVFTDDVAVDLTATGGKTYTGADLFMTFMRKYLSDAVTVHHGHMPEITITSPSTAGGIWAMEDWIWFANGRALHGSGHYHETYRKADGAWRIATLALTRLRLDFPESPVA